MYSWDIRRVDLVLQYALRHVCLERRMYFFFSLDDLRLRCLKSSNASKLSDSSVFVVRSLPQANAIYLFINLFTITFNKFVHLHAREVLLRKRLANMLSVCDM